MTNELKQQFTRRITQANKTEMIVILYEMLLSYTESAKKELEEGNVAQFRDSIRKTKACVEELLHSLHLEYEPGMKLFSLYLYCNRELMKADVRKTTEPLEHVELVIGKLHKAYSELAKQDESGPVMHNSQAVYTGLTYGKDSLTEDVSYEGVNRGFRV